MQTDTQTNTCPPSHIQTGVILMPFFDTFHFTTFASLNVFMKDFKKYNSTYYTPMQENNCLKLLQMSNPLWR
jgi:hypothetical protein